jgi:8-oxo-dGTP pyrophosphatase MutT (NUDIX family)
LNSDIPRIRPLALCIFSHRGRILVGEFASPAGGARFFRPLGGGIEFGERATETLHREMREEIGAEIRDLRYLGTLENIFTFRGDRGHEIVMVFDGAFVDPTMYDRPIIHGIEDVDEFPIRAVWKRLDEFTNEAPVYPEGLIALLRNQT